MNRLELFESAALYVRGLLKPYECLLFERAYHNAAATVQAEIATLLSGRSLEWLNDAPVKSISGISAELMHLQRHPEHLRDLPPRRFEEVVCELLSDMGCECILTPAVKDHGRDILFVHHAPFGDVVGIVECKKWRQDRPIGIDVVERFLFTLRERDRSAIGIVVTTSSFTRGAQSLERKYGQLSLRDLDGVLAWLERYGTWRGSEGSTLWSPHPPKIVVPKPRTDVGDSDRC